MTPSKLVKRLRIDDPDRFRLAAFDPADTGGLDKDDAQALLADDVKRLAELQQRLYADGRWALLIVLQRMDTAGKDGVIDHVMTGLNPQGCSVHAFKAPSEEELSHDFLWRAAVRVPERRRIGIFNRSHYEETLVVRVHPELLERNSRPNWSARTSGRSAFRTSENSSAISPAAEWPCSSSSCTSPGRSSASACWSGWSNPPSAGNSP
jgi:polyphosphate kinase 2 (PPK2 family)